MLDMGFLPRNAFAMLVIMAVATMVLSKPLLKVLLRRAEHVAGGMEASSHFCW